MTGTGEGGPDIGRNTIRALVASHRGYAPVAVQAGLTAETIRRIVLDLTSPTFQTAQAIDRAFGTQIAQLGIPNEARGTLLYRTALGGQVSDLARARGISVGRLLALAGLSYYDLVALAVHRQHGDHASLERRKAGLARLGLAPPDRQRITRARPRNPRENHA